MVDKFEARKWMYPRNVFCFLFSFSRYDCLDIWISICVASPLGRLDGFRRGLEVKGCDILGRRGRDFYCRGK